MNQWLFGAGSMWPWARAWLLPLVAWELTWKGFALWRAARRGEQVWFIAILILNTLGILPIIYLVLKPEQAKSKSARRK